MTNVKIETRASGSFQTEAIPGFHKRWQPPPCLVGTMIVLLRLRVELLVSGTMPFPHKCCSWSRGVRCISHSEVEAEFGPIHCGCGTCRRGKHVARHAEEGRSVGRSVGWLPFPRCSNYKVGGGRWCSGWPSRSTPNLICLSILNYFFLLLSLNNLQKFENDEMKNATSWLVGVWHLPCDEWYMHRT